MATSTTPSSSSSSCSSSSSSSPAAAVVVKKVNSESLNDLIKTTNEITKTATTQLSQINNWVTVGKAIASKKKSIDSLTSEVLDIKKNIDQLPSEENKVQLDKTLTEMKTKLSEAQKNAKKEADPFLEGDLLKAIYTQNAAEKALLANNDTKNQVPLKQALDAAKTVTNTEANKASDDAKLAYNAYDALSKMDIAVFQLEKARTTLTEILQSQDIDKAKALLKNVTNLPTTVTSEKASECSEKLARLAKAVMGVVALVIGYLALCYFTGMRYSKPMTAFISLFHSSQVHALPQEVRT